MFRSRRPFWAPPIRHQSAAAGRARYLLTAAPLLAAGIGLVVAAAACSSGGGSASTSAHTSAPASSLSPGAMSALGAHSLPAQTSRTLHAFPAFYDAHKDVVVVTDAFPKSGATAFHANFAPSLSVVKASSQPSWYVVQGRAAPGQLTVLGSEPGESDYSPLWQTVVVKWKSGVTPKLLTSDNMILSLAKKGELTATKTTVVVNGPVIAEP